ncbi:MAG: hypothetical protein Q9169_005307 [Polycauliona sp. 2 TL-2023]
MKYDKQQLVVDAKHAISATYGGLGCFRQIYEREASLLHSSVEFYGDALCMAVHRSDVDLLNFTLQHGADPGRVISDDMPRWAIRFTPIETAVLCSTPQVAKILIRNGATLKGTAALNTAAGLQRKKNCFELVECLVEEGADVNATNRDRGADDFHRPWGPPLQSAIQAQHIRIVQYLLDKGTNPWIQDFDGRTAWDKASEVGNNDIIQLLARMPVAQRRARQSRLQPKNSKWQTKL